MTFAVSFGEWGGFYFECGEVSWRLCLGWVALTLLFEDLDVWLERYVSLSECREENERLSNRLLGLGSIGYHDVDEFYQD